MSPFKRIVSQLSLSPSAGSQLGYYYRRLKGENLTRRLSLVMGAFLIVLQVATIIAPPTNTNAGNANDVIFNGIDKKTPKTSLLKIYDANKDGNGHTDIQAAFSTFGITRQNLADAKATTVNSSTTNGAGQPLLSLGRTNSFAEDVPYKIAGHTLYMKPLKLWAPNHTYQALRGTRYDGQVFYVLYDCGNLVMYDTTPAPPELGITKRAVSPKANSTVAPGDKVTYQISFTNTGKGAAKKVLVADRISGSTAFVSASQLDVKNITGSHNETHGTTSGHGQLPAGYFVDQHLTQLDRNGRGNYEITVKVDANAADGTKFCNTAMIDAEGQKAVYSETICHYVKRPATPGKVTPPAAPVTPVTPDTPVTPITPVTPVAPPGTPGITLSKKGILTHAGATSNANGATAQGGDTVEYQLTTSNDGTADAKDYVVKEDVSDILEYADITNPGGAVFDSAAGTLTWPKTTIPMGGDITNTFQVKVKDPVPTTPTGASNPRSYDLRMDNLYGNLVSVNLGAPAPKQVEEQVNQVAETLPETGAGTTAFIVFGFVGIIVFFYLRNRQLMVEVKLLRNEYYGGGPQ